MTDPMLFCQTCGQELTRDGGMGQTQPAPRCPVCWQTVIPRHCREGIGKAVVKYLAGKPKRAKGPEQ